ncbi:hypothetical protein CHS0354_013049 [Potamilus streckersoni]|uniref:Aquaporin n=1 Tax=Potamilus streckersoni TaxID=2493646 RepID=A0AAE0S047_9BIVA|nr:hypothetical protein CHS0354_013049 [Potamilus streckersoni]
MSLQDNLQTTVALAHGLTISLLMIGLGGIRLVGKHSRKYATDAHAQLTYIRTDRYRGKLEVGGAMPSNRVVFSSGGHFNPAVSLGVTLAGAINPDLAIGYIISQLLGGLLGATLVRAMLPSHVYKNIKGGNHRLGTDMESSQALLGEAILTTVLVFTFLMSSVNRRTKSNLAPLAIGFAVAVDIISGGPTTGASMNPARALGPAIVSYAVMDDSLDDLFVWWVGPLLGGLVAGLLYRLLFASSDQRWITGDRLCIKKVLTDLEHILS